MACIFGFGKMEEKWKKNGRSQCKWGNMKTGKMGKMEEKWKKNGRKQCFGIDLAGMEKWESVCLDIRSHFFHRLMPRIGGPSGNK